MKSVSHCKRRKGLLIPAFFLILICHLAMTDSSDTAVFHPASEVPIYQCDIDDKVEWNGRTLSIIPYPPLGQGKFGSVHLLSGEDQIPTEDVIMKLIADKDYDTVLGLVDEEIKLAEDMPTLYTATTLHRVFRVVKGENEEIYTGFLLKTRVNGRTLLEIADPEKQLKTIDYDIAMSTLMEFRSELITAIRRLGEEGIFVYDLHPNNIMFDKLKNQWFIVDAARVQGYSAFIQKMKELSRAASVENLEVASTFVKIRSRFKRKQILDFFTGHWEGRDQHFYEKYVDIYLDSQIKSLENKINDLKNPNLETELTN